MLTANAALLLAAVLPFQLAPGDVAPSRPPVPAGSAGSPGVPGAPDVLAAPPGRPESPGRPVSGRGHAAVRFPVLRPGAEGTIVLAVRRRLSRLGFDEGPPGLTYGPAMRAAVWAFQKANGLPPVDEVDGPTWRALAHPARIRPLVPSGGPTRVEIDLRRQLLTVWRNDRPELVTHISTGNGEHYCEKGHCGVAVTPTGDFRAWLRTPGWTSGPLGDQFYTVYFNGQIGFHGSEKVPRHPASHGCIRIPLHNARPIYDMIQPGDPVYVRRPGPADERPKSRRT
ncbi:L,D-transpeptidase family protein [Streptosporangium pseudovulgare]|nr:L,D-transpeptidase family protein [Streptosporangium pseudovulgare]